jgi:hypothetical protein
VLAPRAAPGRRLVETAARRRRDHGETTAGRDHGETTRDRGGEGPRRDHAGPRRDGGGTAAGRRAALAARQTAWLNGIEVTVTFGYLNCLHSPAAARRSS